MTLIFKDLVDIPNLQMLMERFYDATGIPVGIIACDGEILVATGWQEICTRFHRVHPMSAERCRQSDDYIKTHLNREAPVQYKCKNGLWDLAVPIIIADQHIATLFLGQFFYEDEEVDEQFFRRQALEFGFDMASYLDALRHIPVFTRIKVQRIMDFYLSFVTFLVSSGLANCQRAATETALRESEQKFAAAFRTAPICMAISTLDEGRYLEVNDEFVCQHGYARSEIIGRTAAELGLWCEPLERQEIVAQIKRDGEVRNWEVTLRDKDGGIHYGLYSGTVLDLQGKRKLLALRSDITARKLAEKALKESEEKFARTFRFTPSALSITTMADERFLEVNETFELMLGYRRDEVIGRSCRDLGIWESSQARDLFLQAVREKGEVRGVEGRLRSKSGKIVIGLLSAEVIEIKEELCLLLLANDITERKRLEGEIEVLNTELAARACQLEIANGELESFNYTVSHDLRHHITVISAYSNILMDLCSNSIGEEALGYLKEVDKTTHKMEQLIEALMSFARLSSSTISQTTVNLTEMANRILYALSLAQPHRKVSFTVAEGLSATGDAKLLDIVLENLLGNAWKYTGNEETAQIEFGVCEINSEPIFFVRDNGEGFDMAHAEKLFRPFERLPGTHHIQGHGIGLATVQRIIQRHGGQVWADSEPGKGATFFLKL